MDLDEAYEALGDLVSRASGEGYDAFEFVKGEIDRLRYALEDIAADASDPYSQHRARLALDQRRNEAS